MTDLRNHPLRPAFAVIGPGLPLALFMALAGCADMNTGDGPTASAASEAQADVPDAVQLTALVVQAVPIGPMLAASLDKDPNWPVGEKASKVSAEQLQCLRQRLSPEGYQASRAQAVDEFIERHPGQVQDAIDVLEQGGADVMAAIFTHKQDNRNASLSDLTQIFTPAQIGQYASLTQGDPYQPLRQLLVGDSRPLVDRRAGANAGEIFGQQLIRNAIDNCHVPLSALQ
jgi:hypothetical protein